ncbi:MFS transporter [Candidatus Uhrbacteria bacterium]|nr:MFS transporter [Candidatus Uhrbacteria bacterium]
MVLKRKSAVNRIVLTMIYSDFLIISAPGLLAPIYAIFLTGQISGGTISTVGFATTIFWVVKSILQIPVARYVDRTRGERDDYAFLVAGSALASATPLLYYFFAKEVWQVFLFEAVNGAAYAMMVPTYLAIFTRHIDKFQEGMEWTLHSNAVGIGFALAASIGGLMAERYGFNVIFVMVSAIMFLGTVMLLAIRRDITESDRNNSHWREWDARRAKTDR